MKINLSKFFTKKLIYTMLGALLPMVVFSQSDFESWNSINFDLNISKKTSIELSNEIRLDDNASGFKKYQVDFGGTHQIIKHFDISFFYRYSRVDDIEAYINEHLIYAKLGFNYKMDRFKFDFSTRYDRAYEVYGYSTLKGTQDTWRNKAALEYNIYGLPIDPYISYELFIAEKKYGFESNKYRLFGGIKYKMSKMNSFTIFYGTQRSLLKEENSYILGLKYNIDFDL